MSTWLDLAEGHEMVAKAWSMRAGRGDFTCPARVSAERICQAMLNDAASAAASAAAEAASCRAAHDAGALLTDALASFVAISGTV